MPCYHPIPALLNENAPKGYKLIFNSNRISENLLSYYLDHGYKLIDLPCQKCVGCARQRCADWCIRLLGELYTENSIHKVNDFSFITLTYRPEDYPKDADCNLHLDNVSEFFHRLNEHNRRRGLLSPKYFAVSERGEKNNRLHHHAIVFGENFLHSDVEGSSYIVDYNQGIHYYSTPKLRKMWPFGHVAVTPAVNEANIAYTVGYSLKKQRILLTSQYNKYGFIEDVKHDKSENKVSGIRCSKGLGKEFLMLHMEQFANHGYIRDWTKSCKLYGLPRYFKKILQSDDKYSVLLQIVKDRTEKFFQSQAFLEQNDPSVRYAKEYMSLDRLYNRIRRYEDSNGEQYCNGLEVKLLQYA